MSRHCQRRQQQDRLLNEALSHGPYLWSNRDVENALLWFQSSSSSSGSSSDDCDGKTNVNENVEAAIEEGGKEDHDDNTEGCEFLRRLLHARGIGVPRPLPDRRQQSRRSSNKKRKSSTFDRGAKSSADGTSSTNTRKYRKHSDGSKSNKNDNDGARSDNKTMMSAPPLQSILMGYYQLHLTPKPHSNYETLDGDDDDISGPTADKDGCFHFTSSDIQNAEMASSQLLNDLTTIISARRHTDNSYQAFMSSISHSKCGKSDTMLMKSAAGDKTALEMSQSIDEYMTHPTTCTRRAYASSLFDRMLDLCKQGKQHSAESSDDNIVEGKSAAYYNIQDDTALNKFLQKLFGLAATSARTQEVVLLLLLEPVRRLQIRHNVQAKSKQSLDTLLQSQSSVQDEQKISEKQTPHRNNQQTTPDLDLQPLLTSTTSFWCNTSPETIEKVCSCPPLPLLVQFILNSSPRSEILTHFAAATGNGTNHHSTQSTITWWTLPFPLLCSVSQLHFPIACMYIRYWIEMAVVGHEKLYSMGDTSSKIQQPQSQQHDAISSSSSHNIEFEHAIQRIKQFCSTSDRLNLLGLHILQSMEKESRESAEMSLLSEEEKNMAYRKSLAWKAIHHSLLS